MRASAWSSSCSVTWWERTLIWATPVGQVVGQLRGQKPHGRTSGHELNDDTSGASTSSGVNGCTELYPLTWSTTVPRSAASSSMSGKTGRRAHTSAPPP